MLKCNNIYCVNISYMLSVISKEANLIYPEIKIVNPKLKALYSLMTGLKKLIGKRFKPVLELVLCQIIEGLVQGFRMYKSQ